MDEKNITLQALEEKDDENKGESKSSNVENFLVEGGLNQSDDTPNPVKVSPEDASTEPSHSDEAALVQKSHITSMDTAEEVVHSQVTDVAQEQEPCQVIEAAQELEKEDNGLLGFDLNQEGTSVPALGEGISKAGAPFDLNTASPGLQESPREGKRSGSLGLNIDLNHYTTSPLASPLQSSSSSPSSPPASVESFDKNDTEKPRVDDESLLHASEPEASVVQIMGKDVEIKPNDGIYIFGVEQGRREAVRESGSPSSVVDSPPVSVYSSTSGKKRKGPESGLEPNMDAKKKDNSSCSTVDKEGSEPEGNKLGMAERGGACSPSAVVEPPLVSLSCLNSSGGMKRKEPESGSDAYVAKKKKTCSC